ncbi:MAG TPA: hypothetical protein PKH77_04595 [Anaerolineae bacterium]|nr:hypothetical protein [Anaerolineae bacterium]
MATFVHLTPEKNIKSIQRTGIKAANGQNGYPDGFFAQAVTPNFYISHQWLRELKRGGQRTLCGVYFRIPDDEMVWVGHYNQSLVQVSAAEAIGIILHHDSPLGYQVYIPRCVVAKEIIRVSHLPQNIGWRYYPEAHGQEPCGCPICLRRGEIKSRGIREEWENKMK